eukprot:12934192-Prorocentrum_lima.AAC.1
MAPFERGWRLLSVDGACESAWRRACESGWRLLGAGESFHTVNTSSIKQFPFLSFVRSWRI